MALPTDWKLIASYGLVHLVQVHVWGLNTDLHLFVPPTNSRSFREYPSITIRETPFHSWPVRRISCRNFIQSTLKCLLFLVSSSPDKFHYILFQTIHSIRWIFQNGFLLALKRNTVLTILAARLVFP